MLQLHQFKRGGIDEKLDRLLITEPIAAGHGVVKVIVETVVVLDHAGCAAFGCHGVTAHGIDF